MNLKLSHVILLGCLGLASCQKKPTESQTSKNLLTRAAFMDLNQVTLPSTDISRAVAFYKRLGFTQIVDAPPHYARFECRPDGPSFSLHLVEAVAKDNQTVIYFECEDLDRQVAELRKAGIQFETEPTDRPWLWREARLRDPDGNRLCLYHAGRNRLYPPWRVEAGGETAISLAHDNEKIMFAEKFASPLSAGWDWIREDPRAWKVENGKLLLRSLPGYVYIDNNNARNVLLRKAPVTSKVLILEVFLENQPEILYEHAGLYWYYDDDNYVCLLKEWMGKEVRLRIVCEKDANGDISGETQYDAEGVWFRLVIAGDKATGHYRPTDNEDWRKMGQVDLPSKGEPRVGLNAGGGPQKAERWARFSHFRILEQAE